MAAYNPRGVLIPDEFYTEILSVGSVKMSSFFGSFSYSWTILIGSGFGFSNERVYFSEASIDVAISRNSVTNWSNFSLFCYSFLTGLVSSFYCKSLVWFFCKLSTWIFWSDLFCGWCLTILLSFIISCLRAAFRDPSSWLCYLVLLVAVLAYLFRFNYLNES